MPCQFCYYIFAYDSRAIASLPKIYHKMYKYIYHYSLCLLRAVVSPLMTRFEMTIYHYTPMLSTLIYTYIHLYKLIYTYIHLYTLIHLYTYIHLYIHTYIHLYTLIYTLIYTYIQRQHFPLPCLTIAVSLSRGALV